MQACSGSMGLEIAECIEISLMPVRQRIADQAYLRKGGGGRKPKDPRLVFEGIVFVLRTGCQWKALASERFGSASAIHAPCPFFGMGKSWIF